MSRTKSSWLEPTRVTSRRLSRTTSELNSTTCSVVRMACTYVSCSSEKVSGFVGSIADARSKSSSSSAARPSVVPMKKWRFIARSYMSGSARSNSMAARSSASLQRLNSSVMSSISATDVRGESTATLIDRLSVSRTTWCSHARCRCGIRAVSSSNTTKSWPSGSSSGWSAGFRHGRNTCCACSMADVSTKAGASLSVSGLRMSRSRMTMTGRRSSTGTRNSRSSDSTAVTYCFFMRFGLGADASRGGLGLLDGSRAGAGAAASKPRSGGGDGLARSA
mmetsp:Transcript_22197/g.77816  ORF Transcript_22197/g.77816 Transcript_22197/m.77816 type:complete len:278 (+) Transcript_22197:1543-2376(+)